MERVDFLVREVQKLSGSDLDSRYSKQDIVNALNFAQRSIQLVVYNSNPEGGFNSETAFISLVNNQAEYNLPSDIYSPTSVYNITISRSSDNKYFGDIERASQNEDDYVGGYLLFGGKLTLKTNPVSGRLRIRYERSLAQLGFRAGKIASYVGTTITLENGHELEISTYSDYISTVNRDGEIQNKKIAINSSDDVAHTLDVDAGLTGINVGDYIVVGENSTTHPELPNNIKDLLLRHAVRTIEQLDSSTDFATASLFSKEEESAITKLYSNQCKVPIAMTANSEDLGYLL